MRSSILNRLKNVIYGLSSCCDIAEELPKLRSQLDQLQVERLIRLVQESQDNTERTHNDFKKLLYQGGHTIACAYDPNVLPHLDVFFSSNSLVCLGDKQWWQNADIALLWGMRPWPDLMEFIFIAKNCGIPIFLGEDGFIKSIQTVAARGNVDVNLLKGISIVLDDQTAYFDGTGTSRLETWLNSDEEIPDDELQRAKNAIYKIVETRLSKYNHQPIYHLNIGRPNAKKVLVVDQSHGDYSVVMGCANDNTFESMLKIAIQENPTADILVKTHPDTISGYGGYYSGLKGQKNVFPITIPINPISLLSIVDKVYVVSSQLGFEALMCGKEVSVFGRPFYAGWGLTDDRLSHPQRKKSQSGGGFCFFLS